MAAILKIKMATKKTTTSNFPSAFITSLSIISIGIATILSSWGAQKLKYMPKYVENGGHFDIQDGRQKRNDQ